MFTSEVYDLIQPMLSGLRQAYAGKCSQQVFGRAGDYLGQLLERALRGYCGFCISLDSAVAGACVVS